MSEQEPKKLLDYQFEFAQMLGEFIQWLGYSGYGVAILEVARSDEQAEINAIGSAGRDHVATLIEADFPLLAQKIRNNGKANGIRGSLHELRLAADLALFRNRVYLTRTEDYRVAGEHWESMGGTWGGRFNDGNHFSLAYGGRK